MNIPDADECLLLVFTNAVLDWDAGRSDKVREYTKKDYAVAAPFELDQ